MTEQEAEKILLSLPEGWKELLEKETEKEYFRKMISFLSLAYTKETIYPPIHQVYQAFSIVKPEEVRLVILGQDPYFNPDQANGLAFSVNDHVKFPPSLRNIFKELNQEYGYPIPESGSLLPWAKQGVLLLNASLTVKEGEASSHSRIGWTRFTDAVIETIDSFSHPVVFLLWGNFAIQKASLILHNKENIISCAHPSPLSASKGFFGSDCFKKTNARLKALGIQEINFSTAENESVLF